MRAKTSKQLQDEINTALEDVKTKRRQRDLLERPTPDRVLGRIDHALSAAQDQTSTLANAETKISSPKLYKLGNELFDDLENLRRKLLRWRS